MSHAFGDDRLETRLPAVLEERAEEVAAHARPAAVIAAELAPRLRATDRAASRLAMLLRIGAVAATLILVLGLIAYAAGRPRPAVELRIAVEMPLGAETGAETVVNAIRLAVRDRQGGPAGVIIGLPAAGVFSDTVDGQPDPARGADNMRLIAADPRFVAVIGPYNSFVAEPTLPIANAAGILQCSPSNTAPNLTGDGAAALRPRPERPTYVRVAATDDAQVQGAAGFIFDTLGKRAVFVISAGPFAGNRTLTFLARFRSLGGDIAGAASLGASSPSEIAALIDVLKPDAIFFDGLGGDGASLRNALSEASIGLPFVSLDGILDGPRSTPDTFLNLTGDRAANAYGTFPAGYDPVLGPRVEADYRAVFGVAPARFALGGYACAEVIIAALHGLDLQVSVGPEVWREALRASVAEGGHAYQTVLGTIAFDARGDVRPARVSVYRADVTEGDWTFDQDITIGGQG